MSVPQRSSFRREPAERRGIFPYGSLGGLLAAILVLGGVPFAAAQDKPIVTIRPAPPRAARPAPATPAAKPAAPAPSATPQHRAAAPTRRSRRHVATARVRRRTRSTAAEPRVAATPAPQQPERRLRTARRSERTRVAARQPDAEPAPRETPRVATVPRRKVRSRVAGYRDTHPEQDARASDSTDTAPRRRRHGRHEETAARPDSDSSPDGGSGMGAARLNAIGFRLIRQHRYAEAEPYLRRAVTRDPNYAYAQYNLGCSLLAQGKAAQAIGPLQHSAAQQPERWEPQEKLAEAYRRLDDDDRAAVAASRAKHLRRHRRSGRAFPSIELRTAKAVPVRSAVDSGSWRGSTDRREERYLTEWRAMR